MHRAYIHIFALILSATVAGADPATQPSLQDNKLLVLPFSGIGDVANYGWIGQAVQQNLLTEAARISTIQAVGPTTRPAGDVSMAEARRLAVEARAAMVITGSFQLNDAELRLSGMVLDARTGQPLGALKATGALRDLFSLEDVLAGQMRRVLPGYEPPKAATAPPALDFTGPLRSDRPWDSPEPLRSPPRQPNYTYQYPAVYSNSGYPGWLYPYYMRPYYPSYIPSSTPNYNPSQVIIILPGQSNPPSGNNDHTPTPPPNPPKR